MLVFRCCLPRCLCFVVPPFGVGFTVIRTIHSHRMLFRKNRVLLPFGLDYSDIQTNATNQAQIALPVNGPLSLAEIAPAQQQIAFTQMMATGQFFTTTATSTKVATAYPTQEDGIERYLDRYTKARRVARTIDDHPFVVSMFPEELYSVMGVSKKKLLHLSKYVDNGGLREYLALAEDDAAVILERLKNMAENNDDDDEAEEEEEDVDDEFDDDDDEDDYNAEKYFDDGDEERDDGGDEAAF